MVSRRELRIDNMKRLYNKTIPKDAIVDNDLKKSFWYQVTFYCICSPSRVAKCIDTNSAEI